LLTLDFGAIGDDDDNTGSGFCVLNADEVAITGCDRSLNLGFLACRDLSRIRRGGIA
jgi:hypothetical protein